MAWHKKSWFPSPPLNKGGETLAGVPGEVWFAASEGNLIETGKTGRAGTFGPSRNIYVQPGMPALVTTRGHRFALTTVGIPDTPQDLQFVF